MYGYTKIFVSSILCVAVFNPLLSQDFSSVWKRNKILFFGNAKENYQVGKWFYKKNNYDSALDHLLKSLKENESIDAYKLAAEAYVNTYEFEKALDMVGSALFLSPNSNDLQKMKYTIMSLKYSRENTLSEDMNKIAKDYGKTLESYNYEIQNFERRKSNLSAQYNFDKSKLEKKYFNEKKVLDKDYSYKKKALEQEYQNYLSEFGKEKSEVKVAENSMRLVLFLSILFILLIVAYIYNRFNLIETKQSILEEEKPFFQRQKADHQMKIDLELSKMIRLKENINSKKSELDDLENSLHNKEKFVLNIQDDLDNKERFVSILEQDLEKNQIEIRKEWNRINFSRTKNNSQRGPLDPYTVLNLPRETTDQDLIRNHWNKINIICHPDRISSMHPHLKDLAQDLIKDVNRAYDTLKSK